MDANAHTHTHTPILVPGLTTFVELDVRQLLSSTQSICVIHGNDIYMPRCRAIESPTLVKPCDRNWHI